MQRNTLDLKYFRLLCYSPEPMNLIAVLLFSRVEFWILEISPPFFLFQLPLLVNWYRLLNIYFRPTRVKYTPQQFFSFGRQQGALL